MTYVSRETGEFIRLTKYRLLLVSGQSITVEAMTLHTTGHGITFKDLDKGIILSLRSDLVLLIEREGHSIGVSDQDLLAAWDKAKRSGGGDQ